MSIVTLLTDFGTRDGYPGAMKGVILSRAADARVVDLTHDIAAHDVAAGAFALAQAADCFPRGTIHVAVVDPGVGSARRAVVVEFGGQVFIAPDNGLLSMAAPGPDGAWVIESAHFLREPVSNTFHGRDIFAAAAGTIAGGTAPRDAGPAAGVLEALEAPATSVVHIDRFGNLISNIRAEDLPADPRFIIGDEHIAGLSRSYAAVTIGALVAYVGSGGTVEVAVREGNAASRLRVTRGAEIVVEHEP